MNGHVDFASSSEDEFPDLDAILQRSIRQQVRRLEKPPVQEASIRQHKSSRHGEEQSGQPGLTDETDSRATKPDDAKTPSAVRRRRLGQQSDNPLLRPIRGKPEVENLLEVPVNPRGTQSISVRELRNRDRVKTPPNPPCNGLAGDSDDTSYETTEIAEADISEVFGDSQSEFEDNDTRVLFGRDEPAPKTRRPASRAQQECTTRSKEQFSGPRHSPDFGSPILQGPERGKSRGGARNTENSAERTMGRDTTRSKSTPVELTDDMTDALRRLDLDTRESKHDCRSREQDFSQATPPSTPPKQSNKILVSSRKLPGIPKTPHGPSTDLFWSQEFVDDWNEEHSPKKLILPPAQKSPAKKPPKSTGAKSESARQKEARKLFEKRKHDVAQAFLRELDETITQCKLQSLAESTGGIKITWSSKLNTTAGRANWRRETVRSKQSDGTEKFVTHRHYASIELAEKVIDDENRLINVVAHEFCHLANFMVNGITGNPHGKEFKIWAAKCSRAFGDRGIEVTTKHSYEIDFKYVWECTECALEYKRHSKSINPERHRCGSCKSLLRQTKPVPRAAAKPSDYQKFLKEQMKIVREEHPKSPQKEVMKIISDRWAKRGGSKRATPESDQSASISEAGVDEVGARLSNITL